MALLRAQQNREWRERREEERKKEVRKEEGGGEEERVEEGGGEEEGDEEEGGEEQQQGLKVFSGQEDSGQCCGFQECGVEEVLREELRWVGKKSGGGENICS